MSNRDALLLAAKKCLLEKGYNRTTARDIASAAGVSLAAIGYHFASKDALLTEALLLAFGEWDQELQQGSADRRFAPRGAGGEVRSHLGKRSSQHSKPTGRCGLPTSRFSRKW